MWYFVCQSRPTVAEARRGMSLWGSQADLADELERGLSFSRSSATNEGERLDDDDAISLTSSDPAAGALLGYAQEEQEMSEGDEAAQFSCPAYDELLEVMERATARLDLLWKMVAPQGRLDERYLSGHSPPARVSLPFLPDLHAEVEREWKKPFSTRIHRFQHTSYANVEGMHENGYEKMPPVEETLASYLSVGETSSLKAPSSRWGVLNALVRTRVSETSTPFPRGGTVICPHLPLSNSPATTGYSTWPGLGGNLEPALGTHCSLYAGLKMFWLSSMFHRNYHTDGPDPTLRTSPPGLISCAGTMDGWVRSSSTEKLVLCKPFFAVFLGPVVLCVSPLSFDSVQWWPHSSILDPG